MRTLFGTDADSSMHTILSSDGRAGRFPNNVEARDTVAAWITALEATPNLKYRDLFTTSVNRWDRGNQADNQQVYNALTSDESINQFVLPHRNHINADFNSAPDGADDNEQIMNAIVRRSFDLWHRTLDDLDVFVHFTMAQYQVMSLARKRRLLTDASVRDAVENDDCAVLDLSNGTWRCRSGDPGENCGVVDGELTVNSDICD